MRYSRFANKLDTSPLAVAKETANGDQTDESLDEIDKLKKTSPKGPISKKTSSKKPVEKATPKKRKLEEDGDADEEATTTNKEDV